MIWTVAQDVGIDYGAWVRLYQSRHFRDEFPEDNERFRNVTYTEDVDRDREKSLLVMRERMFTAHEFAAAVFIGGMGGILQEYELFRRLQPNASVLPIVSTGGATLEVAARLGSVPPDLGDDLDYVALLHRKLGVSARENRFKSPNDQPSSVEERFWRRRDSAE
ncbi:hypothetical protein IWX58_004587 [Rubrivivax gelatinosus]|nr:hypothetical protein [Rubrivivax gelatinosus]